MKLPCKQPFGMEVWYKVKTCSKNTPDKVFFDDLINMANQCVYTFTYKKLILNVICKNGK